MQRVRMSLPYFKDLGWDAEVVTVEESYVEMIKDPLLLQSVPKNIIVHKVKAFSKKYTAKFGLGSLAIRSMWFYKTYVDNLLKKEKFDLIYFSTTEFPICILGAFWKKKFNIPYVIDMQDPWHSDYYKNKPKSERPKKYWISYNLHKKLEPIAMKKVDGIISVSKDYIKILQERYPHLNHKPCKVITFGAFDVDFKITLENERLLKEAYTKKTNQIDLVYIGRGGYDMQKAIHLLFECFKLGLKDNPNLFSQLHFHFIGTSYAPKGTGTPTIAPLATALDIATYVTEYTDRIGFYESIRNLQQANGVIIIGSNESGYTASKLYPYILVKKPLLGIFHAKSSAATIMKLCNAGHLITLDQEVKEAFITFKIYLEDISNKQIPLTNWKAFEPFTAEFLTKEQVQVFNEVLSIK